MSVTYQEAVSPHFFRKNYGDVLLKISSQLPKERREKILDKLKSLKYEDFNFYAKNELVVQIEKIVREVLKFRSGSDYLAGKNLNEDCSLWFKETLSWIKEMNYKCFTAYGEAIRGDCSRDTEIQWH